MNVSAPISVGELIDKLTILEIKLAEIGLMLGCVVGVIMYLAFKLLLQIGWLASRRP